MNHFFLCRHKKLRVKRLITMLRYALPLTPSSGVFILEIRTITILSQIAGCRCNINKSVRQRQSNPTTLGTIILYLCHYANTPELYLCFHHAVYIPSLPCTSLSLESCHYEAAQPQCCSACQIDPRPGHCQRDHPTPPGNSSPIQCFPLIWLSKSTFPLTLHFSCLSVTVLSCVFFSFSQWIYAALAYCISAFAAFPPLLFFSLSH